MPIYTPTGLQRREIGVAKMTNLWRQFEALSPAAKRQVADFIAFLSGREEQRRTATNTPLSEDPFIGLWADREDLADSRRLRIYAWRHR